jgi:hypothetical protein
VRALARGGLAPAVMVAPRFEVRVRVCLGREGGTMMTSVNYVDYRSFRGGGDWRRAVRWRCRAMDLGLILPNMVLTCHLSSLISCIGFRSIEYERVSLWLEHFYLLAMTGIL